MLVDYSFCIPLEASFVCSRSRVIDRNTTLNSLDCSRNSSFHFYWRFIIIFYFQFSLTFHEILVFRIFVSMVVLVHSSMALQRVSVLLIILAVDANNVNFFFFISIEIRYFFVLIVFGCNPVTNAQAITCVNQATCVGSTCVCASNATTGTVCEIRMFEQEWLCGISHSICF